MRQYPMSLPGRLWVLSGAIVLLLCSVPLLSWSIIPGVAIGGPRGLGGPESELARLGSLLLPLLALLSWAFAPRAVEIEGGELRVLRRGWRAAAFPLSRVEAVAVLPPGSLRGAVRTFGVGGLFGYHGWFYKKGAFRLYATRTDRLVEVVLGGRRIVVSPDQPQRFVDGLLASAPRARLRQPCEPGAAIASRTS